MQADDIVVTLAGTSCVVTYYRASVERKRLPPDAFLPRDSFAKCGKETQEAYDTGMRGKWVGVTLVALAPMPIVWLVAYGFVAIRRRD